MLTRRLSLGPEVAEIARLNDWLDHAFADSGLARDIADDLKLCLNEAVANTMLYAFDQASDPQIVVDIEINERCASAVLTDNGKAFDPLAMPAPALPTDLETAQVGGFGVQLIRDSSSSVDYERRDGLNRLHIICGAVSECLES